MRASLRPLILASSVAAVACAASCTGEGTDLSAGNPSGPGGVGSVGGGSARAVPISGGTLLVSADRRHALAADPDRDRVVLVDLAAGRVSRTVTLEPGDEPGRAAEDAEGRFHVVLRGAGELLTLSATGARLARRPVCATPRGVAVAASGEVVVVCASGELAFVDPLGATLRSRFVAHDLRDVVAQGDRLRVTTFRAAELLTLDADGKETSRSKPGDVTDGQGEPMRPSVAWRMKEGPGGEIFVVHEYAASREILVGESAPPAAYGELSSPVVTTGDTTYEDGQPAEQRVEQIDVLTVDGDVSADGSVMHANAGSRTVTIRTRDGSGFGVLSVPEQPLAAQFVPSDAGAPEGYVVQTRQPALLLAFSADGSETLRVDLGGDDVSAVGHTVFHGSPDGAATAITCASCHPEGRDDGQIWNFNPIGPRRTQSLLGGIAASKPFHWDGDLATLDALFDEVLVKRMTARPLEGPERDGFKRWIDALPELPRDEDASELPPGRAAFEKGGCDGCHSGERFTNGGSADVGTGGRFQVPSLRGLRYRAPYLHDGCAPTVDARFGACGGDAHGDVTSLSDEERVALKAYLFSL